MNVLEEFRLRGMIYQYSEGLEESLAAGSIPTYIGFDPSAPSLHVGSLLPLLALARLQQHGHTAIAVVGGGTGLIGDPSGKSQERKLLTREVIETNLAGLKGQVGHLLDFNARKNPAVLVNNAEWLCKVELVDFLRDIGKYFTVNYMLAKESVKRRIDLEEGISFTEFSYMLLQAYDYLMLFELYGCRLQMGGSDQWGNIVAGIELIRRVHHGAEAHGLVLPLVTTSTGIKFGKTEAGAIWLNPDLTSPFKFYQFWLNTPDQDVISYLKYFTFLSKDEITRLAEDHTAAPEKRLAQRMLARSVTELVHDTAALLNAEKASRVLFGAVVEDLTTSNLLDIFTDVPSTNIAKEMFTNPGICLVDLLMVCGYTNSKTEAKHLIEGGGIYLNNRRASDPKLAIDISTFVEGRLLVVRKGNKDYHLVQITA